MTEQSKTQDKTLTCEICGQSRAHRYQRFNFASPEGIIGEFHDEQEFVLCVGCARQQRKQIEMKPEPLGMDGLTRKELIGVLDRFFAASGVFDICGRCHQQGTGCCPSTCRVMGAAGCDPANKHGKTVFCATFVCSALLNAITECDPELGRTLRWIKRELGAAEFHIYEMITRVPMEAREPVLPLTLPPRYPSPKGIENGAKIREKLAALTDEVLALRRHWHEIEKRENY